jgi:hypothetical protein
VRPLRVIALALAFTSTLVGGLSVAAGAKDDGVPRAELARVRAATARYHDLAAAKADGYELLDVCFEDASGGMGYHYTKGIDAELDPLAPEALVYEPTPHGLKLVGVEYIVPTELAAAAPVVLGRPLHEHGVLPLWILHAWIWRPNPSGMFADFNPSVGGCPEGYDASR